MNKSITILAFAFMSIIAFYACSDDPYTENPCGNPCPETITYRYARLQADGDACHFPEGINDVASLTFDCLIDSAMGAYEDASGQRVTIEVDQKEPTLFPEERVLCGCASWVLPVVVKTDERSFQGGIVDECALGCSGSLPIVEGKDTSLNDGEPYGSNPNLPGFAQLSRDSSEEPWHLKIQDEDGVPLIWNKVQ